MPRNTRLPSLVGNIPDPPRLIPSEDGKIPASLISKFNTFLSDVITAINGRLSMGNGTQSTRSGNIDGQWITFTTPSVSDTQFTLPHGLGRRPTGYTIWRRNDYAELKDSNVGGWDERNLYLKCDTGDVTFLILVI